MNRAGEQFLGIQYGIKETLFKTDKYIQFLCENDYAEKHPYYAKFHGYFLQENKKYIILFEDVLSLGSLHFKQYRPNIADEIYEAVRFMLNSFQKLHITTKTWPDYIFPNHLLVIKTNQYKLLPIPQKSIHNRHLLPEKEGFSLLSPEHYLVLKNKPAGTNDKEKTFIYSLGATVAFIAANGANIPELFHKEKNLDDSKLLTNEKAGASPSLFSSRLGASVIQRNTLAYKLITLVNASVKWDNSARLPLQTWIDQFVGHSLEHSLPEEQISLKHEEPQMVKIDMGFA